MLSLQYSVGQDGSQTYKAYKVMRMRESNNITKKNPTTNSIQILSSFFVISSIKKKNYLCYLQIDKKLTRSKGSAFFFYFFFRDFFKSSRVATIID